MGKFMQWMRQELEGIKAAEIKSSDHPVEDGEEVLGTLTDTDLQKLWVLRGRLNSQMLALAKEQVLKTIDLVEVENKSDRDSATLELCTVIQRRAILEDRNDTLGTLFWTGLRHELSEEALARLHKVGGIGIRKDWKIVAYHGPTPPPLATLLALGLPVPV